MLESVHLTLFGRGVFACNGAPDLGMGSPWIIWEPASLWEKHGGEARQEGSVKTRQRLAPHSPRLRNTCCIRRWRGQAFSSGASRVSMTPSTFWMWTSCFQTWESINSVALSHSVCGDLSQQLWETVHVVIVQSTSRVQLSATPWARARQSVARIGICTLLS